MKTRARATGLLLAATLLSGFVLATASSATPAGDNFADAVVIESLPFERTVDTNGATDEEFESSLNTGCNAHPGIWLRYTPNTEVTVIAVIDGPQRGVAALFEGDTPETLSFIYCMRSLDGKLGSSDGNLHTLQAGQTYSIRLSTDPDEPIGGAFSFLLDTEHGITGGITDVDGRAVGGVVVWAYDGDRRKIAGACSSSKGRYRVSGLPRGTYRLRYEAGACDPNDDGSDSSSVPKGYREWYKNETSFESATRVVVKAVGDTTGIDAVLGVKPTPSTSTSLDSSDTPSASPTTHESPTVSGTPTIDPSVVAGREGKPGNGGWIALVVGLALGAVLTASWVVMRRAKRAR